MSVIYVVTSESLLHVHPDSSRNEYGKKENRRSRPRKQMTKKFCKLDKNYKCTDPRKSMNLKHEEHEANHRDTLYLNCFLK